MSEPVADPPPAGAGGPDRRAAPAETLGSPTGVLRGELSWTWAVGFAVLCLVLILGLWWLATRGADEDRWINAYTLPSPAETAAAMRKRVPLNDGTDGTVPMDVRLIRAALTSLRRVGAGFALAALIGVPLGVLCGCFPPVNAFLRPLTEFGRNIPMYAMLALLIALLGSGEWFASMFICLATVAFVVVDTSQAIQDVPQSYVDTAYTLGASRWQIIRKVLVPLAMPSIFNSLRLLFGLAFGYITVAEALSGGGESAGLGGMILSFQRRGPRAGIYLIVILIPLVAFTIDRILFWVQSQLFPHRYGGGGVLANAVRFAAYRLEDLWRMVVPARPYRTPEDKSSA